MLQGTATSEAPTKSANQSTFVQNEMREIQTIKDIEEKQTQLKYIKKNQDLIDENNHL